MPSRDLQPVAVWLLLVGLTLCSVGLFEGGWLGQAAPLVIVLIAAWKSRLVILHFMEARHAPGHWRVLYELWNFAAAATLVIGYLMSLRVA